MLTTWYTEHAVDFIARHADEPFFLYVPHNMPHVPLFCSDKFDGKSGEGLYADVMMEIDWSVGEIVNALEEAGLWQMKRLWFLRRIMGRGFLMAITRGRLRIARRRGRVLTGVRALRV